MILKKIKRRDFLKTTAVGSAGFALGMNPFQIKTKSDIDRLYDKSTCFLFIVDFISIEFIR